MDEDSWLASGEPDEMLRWLTGAGTEHPGMTSVGAALVPVSERKLRLFAAACCRQVWPLLTDPRSRKAVEVAEQIADGLPLSKETDRAQDDAHRAVMEESLHEIGRVAYAALSDAQSCLRGAQRAAAEIAMGPYSCPPSAQANLLREIFGNPFRPIRLDPAHRTPTVVALAQAAYQCREGRACGKCGGRRFLGGAAPGQPGWIGAPTCPDCSGTDRIEDGSLDPARLTILADALEEAGCADADLLGHLRGRERCHNRYCWGDGMTDVAGGYPVACLCHETPGWVKKRGPCVRGCWGVDLILGKS